MPTYEYECRACGHRFELFQRMTESPRKRCPRCKGKVQRLIGKGAGIIFKGSGFYETDYKKKTGGETAGKEKSQGDSKSGKKENSEASSSSKETKSSTTKT